MIGQFSGPCSPVRTPKFKVDIVAKLFCGLSPSVLTFVASISSKQFKTFFYSNLCINDFKLTRFAFEVLQKFKAVQRE